MLIFWSVFTISGCWILLKAFSASIQINMWFLTFQFVNMVYHIDLFVYIEESFHLWDKAHLIMMCDSFYVLLDSVCQNFLEYFCIYVHQWYWPVIFFSCHIFVWFWYQGNGGLVEWVWMCSFLCNFLEEF